LFINSTTALLASTEASPLSLASNQLLNTVAPSSQQGLAASFCISSTNLALICSTAKYCPNPNSALSSNNEFAQDGPLPSWLTVYGVDGADPPQIDEHPVAFAISFYHRIIE
jgi:hypothetical protein